MISIVTVNWNAYDYAKLLISSVKRFSQECEIIVIDNSEVKFKLDATVYPQDYNIGHGEGLNLGISKANGEYVLILDIDCHIMTSGWEELFLRALRNFDLVAGKGSPAKPIRPACMFGKKQFLEKFDMRATEGYKGHRVTPEGKDVAIRAYLEMLRRGHKVNLLEPLPREQRRYNTLNGEEFAIEKIGVIHHAWHGSHLKFRQVDFQEDLEEDKRKFFSMIEWNFAKVI